MTQKTLTAAVLTLSLALSACGPGEPTQRYTNGPQPGDPSYAPGASPMPVTTAALAIGVGAVVAVGLAVAASR
jgi:hypothetical protein